MKNGFGGVTNFNYNSKHFGLFSHYDYFNSTFKNSDLGFFFSRNNKTAGQRRLQHRQSRSLEGVAHGSTGTPATSRSTTATGCSSTRAISPASTASSSITGTSSSAPAVRATTYDDLDTRGGPPIVKLGAWFVDSFVGTDSRKRVRLSADAHFNGNREGGYNRNYNISLTVQPAPQVQASISTGITDGHDVAQWIRNEDVTGDGVTDHVYGELDRNVVNMTARGTYAFTRDMTLEVYLQPFVAVGDYYNIRRLAKPKSFEFEPVEIADNPDFNTKSLRSNVVFRWEYRRGSTLYLVYNVSNSDETRPGSSRPSAICAPASAPPARKC